MATLEERIAAVSAKLNATTDPAKYTELAMRLNALTAAKKAIDYEDDEDDEDEDEKKSKAKKAEEKKAEEKKAEEKKAEEKSAKGKSKHSEEEKHAEEKKSEEKHAEEEEKSAAAALALIERSTGLTGDAAIGAAAAVFSRLTMLEQQTQQLVAKQATDEKASLIASVTKYVPKSQIEWLEGQKLSVVKGFVAQALKGAPMVHTEEGDLLIPAARAPNTKESLPKEIQAMVESAVAAFPGTKEAKASFETELVRRHFENEAKALNGAGGRF